ncbi:loganic acid O-methyltransferase-like [Rhodamnia argentea]|uniref:Loganic acid O-methyltransferase-like n=1 Tax=Rhodamnia argentea TaxID=178133 RepID=A0A8B8NIF3_9MYRT|nr:loganic acid O-methyltransferase-like [Rhodamnia argentea]
MDGPSNGHPMVGGEGPHSYSRNSSGQRIVIDMALKLIQEAVDEHLEIKAFSSSGAFLITDLGCSAGPNTFYAVSSILQAVEQKCQSLGLESQILEFQIFFSDHVGNDFNTLFRSLPPDRRYYAAGVPGSFYGRLFPKSCLHFVHSSFALHWLSGVPKEVQDKSSPAWNKGRIFYPNAHKEVIEAYAAKFAEDMGVFLCARAQEVVLGGLMVLTFITRPDGIAHSQAFVTRCLDLLESCLVDMVKKGTISEEKMDEFNLPMYYASPREMKESVERNGRFSIKKMVELVESAEAYPPPTGKMMASTWRAPLEGILKEQMQFGEEMLDELFNSFTRKYEESSIVEFVRESSITFVLLEWSTAD